MVALEFLRKGFQQWKRLHDISCFPLNRALLIFSWTLVYIISICNIKLCYYLLISRPLFKPSFFPNSTCWAIFLSVDSDWHSFFSQMLNSLCFSLWQQGGACGRGSTFLTTPTLFLWNRLVQFFFLYLSFTVKARNIFRCVRKNFLTMVSHCDCISCLLQPFFTITFSYAVYA